MKKSIFLIIIFLFFSTGLVRGQSAEQAGLITNSSAHSMAESVEILKAAIGEMGLNIVAEVDHAQAAGRNDLELRPTYLLIFGNPEVGTKLMQADQGAGLDLPLRMLVWENEEGKVMISYHDPIELQENYQLSGQKEILENMQEVMKKLAQKVSK